MKPFALVAAEASTLPRIILDACAAGGRPVAVLAPLGLTPPPSVR